MKLFVLSTLFVALSVSKSIPKLIQQETRNGQQRQLLNSWNGASIQSAQSGSCSIVTEYTLGVTDQNHCKTVGWTYCESTDECIAPGTKASCPVCQNGDIYCKDTDNCCDYDCNQQICVENDEHYTEGVQNVARCYGDYAGYNWCASTGSCIEPGSVSCPQCPSSPAVDTVWCQLLGGGHCCNFKNDQCTNKNGQRRLQWVIQSAPSESTGLCLTVQSITGGVTDQNHCPTLGWSYCESTDECIAPGTRASCPVCQNGYFYCKDTDNCCDHDCNQQICGSSEDYTEGVSNVARCHGVHLGEKWCESLGKCIESGSISCPQCPDNTVWCQLLGGGHCCNFKNDQCTNQ